MPAVLNTQLIKVKMCMDSSGCLYFLVKVEGNIVQLLRHNPTVPMNDENFLQVVLEFRSENVYFFIVKHGLFYVMDD